MRYRWFRIFLILAFALIAPVPLFAIQATRPYGDPAATRGWQAAVWMRQAQPESEATSQGRGNTPQVAVIFNHTFTRFGRLRAFWGGTVLDGEMLFEVGSEETGSMKRKTRWMAGFGGYYAPELLPDEVFSEGLRINAESMKIGRWGARLLFSEIGPQYEMTLFASYGEDIYLKTNRTASSFRLPEDTRIRQYGFSYVWDYRKTARNPFGMMNYIPEGEGIFGWLLGTYTSREQWREWGTNGDQFDDSDQRKHYRLGGMIANTVPQKNRDEVVTIYMRGGYGKDLDRLSAFTIGGATEYDRNPYRFRACGYFFAEYLTNNYYGYNVDYRKNLNNRWVFRFSYDHVFAHLYNGKSFDGKPTQLRGVGTGLELYGLWKGKMGILYGYGMDAVRPSGLGNHELVVSYEKNF